MLSFDGRKITLIMDKKFIFGKQICYICANDMFFCVIIYKVLLDICCSERVAYL